MLGNILVIFPLPILLYINKFSIRKISIKKIATKGIKIDLHIHSEFSKGKDGQKVAENTLSNLPVLVKGLIDNNVEMCAITDHDSFNYEIYSELKKEDNTYNDIREKSLLQWLNEMEKHEDVAVRGGVKLAKEYIQHLKDENKRLDSENKMKNEYLKKVVKK